jgi:hypothetical protein
MHRKNFYKNLFTAFAISSTIGMMARQPDYVVERPAVTDTKSYKEGAADCEPASSQFDLDINNVRAKILNGGDLWWDLSAAKYEVPKIDPPGSSTSITAIFAGAIWISGKDEGGNLKLAAQTYRSGGNDFWPGPIDAAGSVDNSVCKAFDKHFNVYGQEIKQVISDGATKGYPLGSSEIPKNVLEWPGKSNPFLIEKGQYFEGTLAPFFDADDDGIYDPTKGDYPVINASPNCKDGFTFADQMIFWVFNDIGNIHTQTNGDAIGLQINALAFAFRSSDDLNNMTFYRYNIINKSSTTLVQTYMGQFVDPDLGCYQNDYVGCDTNRSLGIVYNGDVVDGGCANGYGAEVPLLGIDYFEGPQADKRDGIDNDKDGLVDEGTDGIDNDGNGEIDEVGEQELLGMSSFSYFNNAAGALGDPNNASQYRNYMEGKWSDGTPITYGGNGYGGANPTHYTYPGDPSISGQWSECNNQTSGANVTADRRFLQFSGPFTLKPGDANNITLGVIFVRPKAGAYPCPSFSKYIGPADDKAQALFDNCFKVLDGPDAPTLLLRELDKQIIISLVNSAPTSNNKGESYDVVDAQIKNIDPEGIYGLDRTFTFQGYKLYQLSSSSISFQDLNDLSKARLVSQVDIKDGVSTIINYDFDNVSGSLVPSIKVEGQDKGIKHSFNIISDLFAQGDAKLINHKTYYYTAVAYAYNTFEKVERNFLYLSPITGDSVYDVVTTKQLKPYLQGNGNLAIYTAIPHITAPRNGGTILNAKYNDSIAVTRLQGTGNGSNLLSLSQESMDGILASPNNKLDIIKYVPGGGPIDVRVADPLKLKDADYKVVFVDTNLDYSTGILSRKARWMLIDVTNNDTVFGERDINTSNEQIIYKTPTGKLAEPNPWGLSITIGQSTPVYNSGYQGAIGAVYGALESNITFEDPEKPWLSFILDQDGNKLENWIRSGEFILKQTGSTPPPTLKMYDDANIPVLSQNVFHDKLAVFEKMASGAFAPYCLAANFADFSKVPSRANPDALPFLEGPGFKWDNVTANAKFSQNNLDSLSSVVLVITPDKSKWTRCVVFEEGEQSTLNETNTLLPSLTPATYPSRSDNAYKGEIRSQYSVDKDGKFDLSDIGRGWFPGYAINLETGERLNMAFGESSNLADQNGRDMIWNPTSDLRTDLNEVLFGGKHYIYVFKTVYDEGAVYQQLLLDNFNKYSGSVAKTVVPTAWKYLYKDLLYTGMPYLTKGYKLKSVADGLVPSTVTINLRVDKPYQRYITSETNESDSLNVYQFSTKGMAPKEQNNDEAKNALDLINVVPNPYYANSGFYETSILDTRVKITNLPNKCTVSIYTLDGSLVKKYERDIPVVSGYIDGKQVIDISEGEAKKENSVNLESSLDWDLKNFKNIPISSGVYLIHIAAPGIGERTIKWFGVLRPTDLESF